MLEIVLADGRIVHRASSRDCQRMGPALPTRRCDCCGVYFTGPGPILPGPQGRTVIVCSGCKEHTR